jgi:hypothetical protein
MKANKSFMQMLLVGAFAFFTFTLSSCSKQDFDGVTAKSTESAQTQVLKKVKSLKYNFKTANGATSITSDGGGVNFSSGDKAVTFSGNNGSTSFANDQGSSNFSNGEGSNTYSSGEPTNSFELKGTLSAGGGSMTVAGKSINLDYIFCADAADMFGEISGFEGEDFNLVIGIAGDFADPENARLNYMVFMITVGDGSSGSYKLDLDLLGEEVPTGKFGIIEVIDFSNLKQDGSLENFEDALIYVSTKGSLNASSGSYAFSSVDMAELAFDQDGELDLGKKVKGSGNLLCQ